MEKICCPYFNLIVYQTYYIGILNHSKNYRFYSVDKSVNLECLNKILTLKLRKMSLEAALQYALIIRSNIVLSASIYKKV